MGLESVSRRPLVLKFGGTSVGSGARFVRAAKIVAGTARNRPVAVVVSAMSGATDTLLGFADATGDHGDRTATGGTREGSLAELHRSLAERHLSAAREAVSEELLPGVEQRILRLMGELASAIEDRSGGAAARRAEVAVHGERLSAEVFAGAIASLGAEAAVTGDPISTDGRYPEATVDAERTRERCKRFVAPILDVGSVAVVPGYVGRSPEGRATTLGRGGSDLSATVLGRALGSSEVCIFSDVDGVLDADPRLVPDAATVPELSYREAGTFASLGAEVLHPKTLEPAEGVGIEVRVRSSFDPESAGTLISAREGGPGVRCVALRRGGQSAVVCIGSPGEEDRSRGLRGLREAGIRARRVEMIRDGLVFSVVREDAEAALRAVHGALLSGRVAEVVA
jgi:aspartate kinase